MKRKRVGAGQRGSSNPYTVAKDLLQHSESAAHPDESATVDKEAPSAVTSSIRAKAATVAASLDSPTKMGKAMNRKQQKLAEAAKSSRSISQYFAKKETPASSQAPPPELPSEHNDGPEAGGSSPTSSETAAVGADIITVPDKEEEEKEKDKEEEDGDIETRKAEQEEDGDKSTEAFSE